MKALHAGAQELGLALLACFTCANASIVLGKGHEKYSFAKAGRIPEVGVDAVHSICDPLVSECLPSDKRVQDELVVALQADSHTTGERAVLAICRCGDSKPEAKTTRHGRSEKLPTHLYGDVWMFLLLPYAEHLTSISVSN